MMGWITLKIGFSLHPSVGSTLNFLQLHLRNTYEKNGQFDGWRILPTDFFVCSYTRHL